MCTILQENGFKVKPSKCKWCRKEVKFLGHKITPIGVNPLPKKIDAILKMQPTQAL